jgi:large subunit ribosomal protein L9
MKVLLLQDVYKLGRAGDVKKVANGYGRNYLIPQGLAVLATQQAINSSHHIREQANVQREQLNKEMDAVAKRLKGLTLIFPARASETGKLYGSVTTQMIAEAVSERTGVEVSKRQVEGQPLRNLGEHIVAIRLTVDLIPEINVIVHREGEAVTLPSEVELDEIDAELQAQVQAEVQADVQAEVIEEPEMIPPQIPQEAEVSEAEQPEELEEAE